MRAAWACALLLASACSQVAEVLTAPASFGGSGGVAAGGGSGESGAGDRGAGEGGGAAAGGAAPEDPELGVRVDAGDSHACAVRYGALYCWGQNRDGQLGLGDDTPRNTPARVDPGALYRAVATGVAHTCALRVDGSVWCFGANQFGQLGQGHLTPSWLPVPIDLPGRVTQLSSGSNTACAVLESGELYCWGRNWEGNIGLGDTHPGVDRTLPVRSGSDSDWLMTATGDGHTCGVRGEGLLMCWGRNSAANLGLGQTTDPQRREAASVGMERDWYAVASGQDGSCGLRGDGRLFCWGGNAYGALGVGDRDARLLPAEVDGSFAQISLDTFHACGVDMGGRLHCWGRNVEGQLGSDDNEDRLEPLPVAAGSGFREVAVGRFSSCAVSEEDLVYCTGENGAGQLGTGDTARRNRFSLVALP